MHRRACLYHSVMLKYRQSAIAKLCKANTEACMCAGSLGTMGVDHTVTLPILLVNVFNRRMVDCMQMQCLMVVVRRFCIDTRPLANDKTQSKFHVNPKP